MARGSENLEDSHMGKIVQTNDQKDEEKVIEIEKVKGVGVGNGGNKLEGEREIGIKNDEAKKEDVGTINEVKNDEAIEGDVKEIKETKNNEEMKGFAEETSDIKIDYEAKELRDVTTNEMKNEETKKEDEGTMDEIDISVDDKEDQRVEDGEVKKKEEENEGKEVEENKVYEGLVKERVVTIDQNPKFIGENGDISNKSNDEKKKKKKNDIEGDDVSSCNVDVSSLSYNEESDLFANLKENEKRALVELRSKVEEAINGNHLFKRKENKEKSSENNSEKEMAKPKENEVKEDAKVECGEANASMEEPTKKNEENGQESEEKKLKSIKDGIEEKIEVMQEGMESNEIIKDIKLWGIPLLPSKGGTATDVVLLKFLRARDFKVIDAFEMLRNTLQWRKENNMDSILDEDFGSDFYATAFINGIDRQGHPVCYNIFGMLSDEDMYQKTLGTEDNREKFLRWRLRLMEEGIEKLDFNSVSSLMQISDLKNTPGPSKKEVRHVLKQVAGILQDNYPEFVVKHVFINVPFWYYAFAALLSPFLTQRTKSKFVYARPSKVIETLLKYIDTEEIPICYGGLKRDNDSDFSPEDHAEEVLVKANSIETIEIPTPEAGSVVIWDLIVLGWEISYREEFIPDNEKSYGIIVQKQRKMAIQEGSVRNSFKNSEPGKIILIIDNAAFKTKKRAFYRYKIKQSSS